MSEVNISGPDGRLEGRYYHSRKINAPIALVLHPNPEHGGSMHSKVVYSLYQVFRRRGYSILRINFRGVGRSEGTFDQGEGELSDAASALDWMQGYNPNPRTCWVAGFSFGAWIGMQLLMRRPEVRGFISVALPANKHDFTFLAPCPTSGLIVQGKDDEQVSEEEVTQLIERMAKQRDTTIQYSAIDGADHFFRSKLDDLERLVDGYLTKRNDAFSDENHQTGAA